MQDLFDVAQPGVVEKTIQIAFDGGTPCNIPRLGFGDGYGSYQLDDLPIVRLEFKRPMSNNAAEISTLVCAIQAARLLDATHLVVTGDSQIALNWLDRAVGNRPPRKKKKTGSGSPEFLDSIARLNAAVRGLKVTTQWKGRENSVRIFGH